MAVQVLPQLMPDGVLMTVPLLLLATVSLKPAAPPPPPPAPGSAVKVAPTSTRPLTITLQVRAVPEQAPVQLLKTLPLPAEGAALQRPAQ